MFKKDDEHQINVYHEVGGTQQDFSYVDMIKALIDTRKLEEPEISGGFTEAEIKSIKSMVTLINKTISTIQEPEEWLGSEQSLPADATMSRLKRVVLGSATSFGYRSIK